MDLNADAEIYNSKYNPSNFNSNNHLHNLCQVGKFYKRLFILSYTLLSIKETTKRLFWLADSFKYELYSMNIQH